jgi:hypothetical protein
MFGPLSRGTIPVLQELVGHSSQLVQTSSVFDVVCLCWPRQNKRDASQNLFHLYAIVHALRNAKMYNKPFFKFVLIGLCEGQIF